jgi:hypothetical protein
MKLLLVVLFLISTAARAEVTRVEITAQTPFAGGKEFGAVGPYVRITGRFYGDLEPSNPNNKGIADIHARAQRAGASNTRRISRAAAGRSGQGQRHPSTTSTTAATSGCFTC